MRVFKSKVDTQTSEFQGRLKHSKQQLDTLHAHLEQVQKWGMDESHPKLIQHEKWPVRKRIKKLLDSGSQFLELSSLAGHELYSFPTPAGGLITGIGLISGRECVIIANDPTVKAGAYLPITVKKQLRAQEIALDNHLPCIYLVDSAGAYLPLQSEVFPDAGHFGAFFYNQAQMSALGLDQISIVCGHCTAGGAYIPAMCDQTIMVKSKGACFLGGPALVRAATGEEVSAEELGGAYVHCTDSGVADYQAETEEEAIERARGLFQTNRAKSTEPLETCSVKEPIYDPKEIYGLIPKEISQPLDIKEILARILDGSEWEEFKEDYGTTLFTGWAHLYGYPVGVVAANGILFSESALKATHFIDLCDRRKIPLLFFHNVMGFMVGKEYERRGIAKHGAQMVNAVSLSRVPKFSVLIGASYGAGNYGMCGRAFKPRQLWMWPSGKISVMGAQIAEQVMASIGKKAGSKEDQQKTLAQYQKESSPYYSTARLWDDGIIDPVDTRRLLAMGISASLNKPFPERKKGVYRM